jgi:hypothetical protein
MTQLKTLLIKFVTDRDGKVVIMQPPNIPIIGWLVFMASSLLIKTAPWHDLTSYISFGFLFTWAWLEITQGKSYFRRTLGVIVLILMLYPHFK